MWRYAALTKKDKLMVSNEELIDKGKKKIQSLSEKVEKLSERLDKQAEDLKKKDDHTDRLKTIIKSLREEKLQTESRAIREVIARKKIDQINISDMILNTQSKEDFEQHILEEPLHSSASEAQDGLHLKSLSHNRGHPGLSPSSTNPRLHGPSEEPAPPASSTKPTLTVMQAQPDPLLNKPSFLNKEKVDIMKIDFSNVASRFSTNTSLTEASKPDQEPVAPKAPHTPKPAREDFNRPKRIEKKPALNTVVEYREEGPQKDVREEKLLQFFAKKPSAETN